MTDALQASLDQKREVLKAALRLEAAQKSHDSLLDYMKFSMPDPQDPDDVRRTNYRVGPQSRLLCQLMEKVEKREYKNVAVSVGPQMGKSEIISRGSPAWFSGRNPHINMILGSYNQDMANGFGDDVRERINAPLFKQIFPDHKLRKGGQGKENLVTTAGGKMAFVGVGGSGTGKPADVFIVDDPIKSDEEAQSETYRERVWNWFTKVVNTRTHNESAIVIVHTRWSEDDLIGRLVDKDHPNHDPEVAEEWEYFNLPAVVSDPDLAKALGLTLEVQTDPKVVSMFGVKPIACLWPWRFNFTYLASKKRLDKRGFEALRQGNPAPEDGDYFRADDIVEYRPHELPKNLRKYGASDHAVSEKQTADLSAIGCVGIDEHDDIWVFPDLVWERMETDRTVEELLVQFKTHQPLLWWMESELISKSFGPFLIKRMHEEKIYTTIDPVTPAKDKKTRGRAIQGRMRMRKVHFPSFAPWWQAARNQLLKFPYGTHDDFVDWLAHIGMGLLKEVPAGKEEPKSDNVVTTGSIEWILADTLRRERKERAQKAAAGW